MTMNNLIIVINKNQQKNSPRQSQLRHPQSLLSHIFSIGETKLLNGWKHTHDSEKKYRLI